MLQDWLYEDGEDATKAVYVAKIEEIRAVAGPIVQRYNDKLMEEQEAKRKVEEEVAAAKRAEEEAKRKVEEEKKKAQEAEKAAQQAESKDAEMADAEKPAEGEEAKQ